MPTFRQDTKIGTKVPMMKTDDYNDQSVTKDKIRDGNITAEKLAEGVVSTSKLADGAVSTSKIADQNVTKEKIADQSVDNSKLSPEAVTYDKLKDKSVITEKLNDRAVTTEKVEEKAITNAKLGDQSVDGRVVRLASIEGKHLENNAVSTSKIASRSVTNEKIAYNSVSRAELTPEVRSSIDKKADAEQVNNSLYDLEKKIGDRFVVEGNVTNLPDDEDLTSVKESERYVLKLADRSYAPQNFSGKGYKILRKNIKQVSIAVTKIQIESAPFADGTLSFTINGKETQVAVSATTDKTTVLVAQKVASALQESMTEYDVSIDASLITLTRKSDGSVTPSAFSVSPTGVVCTVTDSTKREFRNILTPDIINQPNTIYEIRYDFDLNGEIITIPENCVFKFCGGSFKNGTLNGKNSIIEAYPIKIFDDINIIGTFLSSNEKYYCEWFGGDIEKCIYSFKQINFVGTYNINNQIYIEGDNISPKIIFEKTSKIHVSDTFNDDYLFKFKISGYNEGNIIDQSCLFEGNGYINLNKRCGFCTFEKYNDKSIEVKFLNLVINGAGIGDNDPDNTQICIIKTLESTIMMNVSCYTDRQKNQPYAGIYLGGADNKLHRVTVIVNTIGIAHIGGSSIIEDAHIWGAPQIAFEVIGNATFAKCYGDWAVINYYFGYNNPMISITDHFYIGMNADQNDDYSNIYKSTTFIKVKGGTGAIGHANMICQNSTTRVIPYSCYEPYYGGNYTNPCNLDIKVIGGKVFSQLTEYQKNSILIKKDENKIILSGLLTNYVKYVCSIYIYNINKVIDLELTKSGYHYNDSSVDLSDYIELYRTKVNENTIFYIKAIKSDLYIKLDPSINLTIFKYNYISLPKDGAIKCNIVNTKPKEDKISINLGEQDNGTHFYKICKLDTIYNIRFLDAVFTLSSSLSARITIDFRTFSIYFQNVFRNTDNDLTNYLDFYISKDKSVLYVKTSVKKSSYADLLFYLRTVSINMTFYNTLADDVNIDDLTLMNKYDSYTKGKDVTGSYYFNKSNNALMIYTNKWKKVKTIDENLQESGSTLNRPVNIQAGFLYFDTNLNKPIWWTGKRWVDATGADV